jgi:putative ATP-dependent endonuclease of OLD family
LWIENFKGIKSLDWKIPASQQLTVLIGPGDSGKSTILEAIHFLLSDRWMIPFTDTDFYGTDILQPIVIKALLVDIPDSLKKEAALGLWLSGVDDDGEVHQDPEDEFEPALLVQLAVDGSLEPKWSVLRSSEDHQNLSSLQRRSFSTFKVDDRTDAQLRWSHNSPLGRMSSQDGSERDALSAAARAARDVLADHENSTLNELAGRVQERANKIGGGKFSDIKPGLDTSRSSMGAALALYEGVVPLTSFGLGSRRLASLAVQQLAAGSRSVAVIDELESGLEPHRAVRLLRYLLDGDDYSQVVITTHSPVIVEQANLENLAAVQNQGGVVSITSLGDSSDLLQRLRRSAPSSLLAKRVVVAEGKTEHGLLLACIDLWDAERSTHGLSTAAGEGVAIQDGNGGSEAAPRAAALLGLGVTSAALLDNDDRSVDAAATAAANAGVKIIRWGLGHNTEAQVCAELNANQLTELIKIGSELRNGDDTVLQDLKTAEPANLISSLNVKDWASDGISIVAARSLVALAASVRGWFKTIDGGRVLGEFLARNSTKPEFAQIMSHLDEIKAFIYPEAQDAEEAQSPGVSQDG